jgi:quercetin dioxygenase-like cupin family protein
MKKFIAPLMLSLLSLNTFAASETEIKPLLTKEFADIAGKEGVMLKVTYAPGAKGSVHRHNAHTFVYVLEGSVIMQLKGKEPVTLKPGDTFYEDPNDIHVVGKNASATEPATFLVFFVKNQKADLVVPVKE